MSLIPLERYPIGTVLSIIMPRWFIFGTQQIVGVVTGMTMYPGFDSYIVLSCRDRKGRCIERPYRPGFLDALRQEQQARILWTPPYAKKFRKAGDENPLISFPKGTWVRFDKDTWGMVVDGSKPTQKNGNFWGIISVEPLGSAGFHPDYIGAEQISSYALPSWNISGFVGFPFPDLKEFLPESLKQSAFAAEGLSLP